MNIFDFLAMFAVLIASAVVQPQGRGDATASNEFAQLVESHFSAHFKFHPVAGTEVLGQRGELRGFVGEPFERVILEIPATVAADSDRHNVVALRIHRRHHGQRGAKRNFVFTRASSKEDTHLKSFF